MERFRDEDLTLESWEALRGKEVSEAAVRAAFEAELAAEKSCKMEERAEAIQAFVAFGCGYKWEAENMLLKDIEAHIFGATEEE